jgi:hypothetical protein
MSLLERFSAILLFVTLLWSSLCCGTQDGDCVREEEWSFGTEADRYPWDGAADEPVPQRDTIGDVVTAKEPRPVQNKSCVDWSRIPQDVMRSSFHTVYTPKDVPSETAYK